MTLNDPAARFWNSLGSQRYDVGPAHAYADGKVLWIGIEHQPATQAGKTILPLRDLDRRCTLGQTRKILDQRTILGTRAAGRRRLRAMT